MPGRTRLSLIEEIQQSNQAGGWSEFTQEYGDWIRRWLISQKINASDADDIQQEVMKTVITELGNFEHNRRPGAFRTWLRRIMVNRVKRLFQQKKNYVDMGGEESGAFFDQLDDPSSRVTIAWDRQHDKYLVGVLMNRAEQRFGSDSVNIFRQVAIEEKPAQMVANNFKRTLGSVRVIQHRILRYLKESGKGMLDL